MRGRRTLGMVIVALCIQAGVATFGKTTRYWDCCKPSCAWNGKAPVTRPVLTCSRDGWGWLSQDDQSGCTGGSAYTCNNHVPWAVNDELSYGFAAAHISGQGEWHWCCACYELRFTSGPVSGKRMIVQVTNTGGDLGDNHFDLQMPGGGVGMFNGCKSQWGTPEDGWGNRYGGIWDEGMCWQLPGELREGCLWRFRWFRNADNPNVHFKPVACPRELTERSLCSRTQ